MQRVQRTYFSGSALSWNVRNGFERVGTYLVKVLSLLLDRLAELGELLLLGLLDVLVLLGLVIQTMVKTPIKSVSFLCAKQPSRKSSGTYLFSLGPALGGSGGTSLFGRAVGVASRSHDEGGGLGDAGERGGRDTEERHVVSSEMEDVVG